MYMHFIYYYLFVVFTSLPLTWFVIWLKLLFNYYYYIIIYFCKKEKNNVLEMHAW